MRFTRLAAALLAASLLLPALAGPSFAGGRLTTPVTPPAANVGGSCSGNLNAQIFIPRAINTPELGATSGTYFDDLEGTATVTSIPICLGLSKNDGGSTVLPVNIQHGGGGGNIFQLGYCKLATMANPQFCYAEKTATVHLISSPSAVVGNMYMFRLYRRASGKVSYEIWSGATNIWRLDTDDTWTTSGSGVLDYAWWGYEDFDFESAHDGTPTSGRARMHDMEYSTDDWAARTTISGITCGGNAYYGQSPIKNFTWDGSFYEACEGTRDAYSSTYTYTNDSFDVWTTD